SRSVTQTAATIDARSRDPPSQACRAAPSRAASPEAVRPRRRSGGADTSADKRRGRGGGGAVAVAAIHRHSSSRPGTRRCASGLSNFLRQPESLEVGALASMALADSNSLITWRRLGLREAPGPRPSTTAGHLSRPTLAPLLTRSSRGPAAQLSEAACSCAGPAPRNPRSPRSSTSNLTARGSASARTSLNRLLLNRLSLLSKLDTHPRAGRQLSNPPHPECYSVNSAEADWLRHNSELTASSAVANAAGLRCKAAGTNKKSSAKRSTKIGEVGPQRPGGEGRRLPHPREDDDGGDELWHRQHAVSEDLVRHPEPYHLCATWCGGPNMLRRELPHRTGQRAYLNALQPSSLPMQYLIAAGGCPADIEVAAVGQPEARGIPRGQRAVQLTGPPYTDIDHPAGQSGDPGSPVRRVHRRVHLGWLDQSRKLPQQAPKETGCPKRGSAGQFYS
uniref:Protein kinase domain-containing protein n=1 Tax=Macrostomum lignano TaxID=282301 RepID=A0A1I8FEP5_9PLAT